MAAPRWAGELPAGVPSTHKACPQDCTGLECHRDVFPVGGRLAIFFSRELLHEVCPTWQRRWALTLWVEDARLQPLKAPKYRHDLNVAIDAMFVQKLLNNNK